MRQDETVLRGGKVIRVHGIPPGECWRNYAASGTVSIVVRLAGPRTAAIAISRAPTAITLAIPNAVPYPAVTAWLTAACDGTIPRRSFFVTVAAIVPSTARPIEPPSCCPTFSNAELIPDSPAPMPVTATIVVVTKINPRPKASAIIGARTPETYPEDSLMRERPNSPRAPASAPIVIGARAPMRPTRRDATCAPTTTPTVIGRNARPAFNGL